MSEERRKQIAPAVVLASHGNKDAYRDVYIYYHKNIFFICKLFTGDTTVASDLTVDIFKKVFETIGNLEDHRIFENWLYSYAVNYCKKMSCAVELSPEETEKNILLAAENAKQHNTAEFNRNMADILKSVFTAMPVQSKAMMCYEYFAGIDTEKIAILEKIREDSAAVLRTEAEQYLDNAAEELSARGIEITPFLEDLENTLFYLASKTVVFESVHRQISDAIGVNVNPLDVPKKTVQQKKESAPVVSVEPEKRTSEKKIVFTKKDILYFAIVLIVAVCIFSGVKVFYETKKAENTTNSASVQQQQTPVLVWNGAAAASFASGNGTKEDPYIISSGGQLAYLANLVNDGNSFYAACHYRLGADIRLNISDNWQSWGEAPPENEWTPIGYKKDSDTYSYFTGTFDGAGHTIYGMYVNQEDEYAGLFGVVRNAHIRNLNVAESYVKGGSYAGGIAGYFSGDAADMAGFEYCSFIGTVVSTGNNAGGITGYFSADGEANTLVITDCCSFGSVTAEVGFAGGICGVNEAVSGNVKIVNCFNAGNVTSPKNAGGITGNNRCKNGLSTVEKCYNAGQISADKNEGSITGLLSCVDGNGRASAIASFCLEGTADAVAVKAQEDERLINMNNVVLTDSQMKTQGSFDGFNFDDIWTFSDSADYGYPVLRSINIGVLPESESETA